MTLETTLIFLGAIVLGVTHAFEVDHMTAVSAFVAKRPSPRQAAIFGIQWSVGHGLSLLVFGSVLYALKLTLTESFAHWMERLVGFALLGLGWWTLLQLRAGWQHTHSHQHAPDEVIEGEIGSSALRHTHADGTTHSHSHDHGSFWMGILHGAAGTAAFVGESLVAVSLC